jgi:protein-serine/threonine kinase
MAYASRRPLPTPPINTHGVYEYNGAQRSPVSAADAYHPYHNQQPYSYPPFYVPYRPLEEDTTRTTLPGGTLLHKGFYDLLALATPVASRFLGFGAGSSTSPLNAGPRYEDIKPGELPKVVNTARDVPPGAPSPLKKGRRIAKDMIGNPTGFV